MKTIRYCRLFLVLVFLSSLASLNILRSALELYPAALDEFFSLRESTASYENVTTPLSTVDLVDDDQIPPFWPNRVLHTYIHQHSSEVVDFSDPSRRYALVSYWCPDRAGNILHNLFASVTWAIITNRTLLVHYEDTSNLNVRNKPNVTDDFAHCESILQRAAWIPIWDPSLGDPVPLEMDAKRLFLDEQIPIVRFPQIRDIDSKNPYIERIDWNEDPLFRKAFREYLFAMSKEQQIVAGKLYHRGVDFLYGMLFRELFQIQAADTRTTDEDVFSVALHSRHIVAADDGSFINEEQACLDKMLPSDRRCVVYLMSDREETLRRLAAWLHARNCTTVVASHEENDASIIPEHGPFSGRGFFQDLSLASNARDGVVGDVHRSSYMLLQELVSYDREIDAWKRGLEALPNLQKCKLSNRDVKGYDYGPGTPRFVRRRWLTELEPIQVFKEYRKKHSSASSGTDDAMILSFSCHSERYDEIREMMNGLLVAIATNRSIVWVPSDACRWIQFNCTVRDDSSPACLPFLGVQEWVPVANVSHTRIDRQEVGFDTLNETALLDRGAIVETTDRLFKYGLEFLYGMLFDGLFRFNERPFLEKRPRTIPVVLHVGNVSSMSWAFDCLRALPTLSPCGIVVLGDISDVSGGHQLMEELRRRGCGIEETPSPDDWKQRLELASIADSTFMSDESEFSRLVMERIELRRRTEAWAQGRVPPHFANFTWCRAADDGSRLITTSFVR